MGKQKKSLSSGQSAKRLIRVGGEKSDTSTGSSKFNNGIGKFISRLGGLTIECLTTCPHICTFYTWVGN